MTTSDPWQPYLQKSLNKPSNPVTTAAAEFNHSGLDCAVDVGCGAGNDSAVLLDLGYQVAAYDGSAEAVRICTERFASEPRFVIEQARFETYNYPKAGLVVAFSSLFFCEPDYFDLAWANLSSAIQPGGVFVGHFLGPEDDWARGYRLPTCPLSKDRVLSLFADFHIHTYKEQNEIGSTRLGFDKHWHTHQLLAIKR